MLLQIYLILHTKTINKMAVKERINQPVNPIILRAIKATEGQIDLDRTPTVISYNPTQKPDVRKAKEHYNCSQESDQTDTHFS